MLHQMATIARAQSLLAEARCLPENSHNPATALVRLMTEGLVYLNYMLVEDSDWRSRVFAIGDEMLREYYECCSDGRPWHRYHGSRQLPARPDPVDKARFIRLTCQPDTVDDFEAEWIFRHAGRMAEMCPATMRGLVPSPGTRAGIDELRQSWNVLGNRIGDKKAKAYWTETSRQWNCLKEWPFGLRQERAVELGRLGERIQELVQKERNPNPEFVTQTMEWIHRLGLDLHSDLAHFSPARVFLRGAGFTNPALANALLMLFWATRLLEPHFAWASDAKKAV